MGPPPADVGGGNPGLVCLPAAEAEVGCASIGVIIPVLEDELRVTVNGTGGRFRVVGETWVPLMAGGGGGS